MKSIIDISLPVGPQSPVWPGDQAFEHWRTGAMADGAACDVSAYAGSAHLGTHVDAPSHYIAGGATVDEIDPSIFVGPTTVVDTPGAGHITADALIAAIGEPPQRLLLRTCGTDRPVDDPRGLTPDAARWLADRPIGLIGVDAGSVAFDEHTDEVHRILLQAAVVILEGLDLRRAPAGDYDLIALPIKLTALEAAPVRAVLTRR